METLKRINEITNPDHRNTLFQRYDHVLDAIRKTNLDDIYAIASKYSLHVGVPEDVRSTYAIAQNMYAFSWFYYPFNSEAGLVALRATERALKLCMNMEKSRIGLKKLVIEATKRDLLSEDNYTKPAYVEYSSNGKGNNSQSSYISKLPDILSVLRNNAAHGDSCIHWYGELILRLTAETINQLFICPEEFPSSGGKE